MSRAYKSFPPPPATRLKRRPCPATLSQWWLALWLTGSQRPGYMGSMLSVGGNKAMIPYQVEALITLITGSDFQAVSTCLAIPHHRYWLTEGAEVPALVGTRILDFCNLLSVSLLEFLFRSLNLVKELSSSSLWGHGVLEPWAMPWTGHRISEF